MTDKLYVFSSRCSVGYTGACVTYAYSVPRALTRSAATDTRGMVVLEQLLGTLYSSAVLAGWRIPAPCTPLEVFFHSVHGTCPCRTSILRPDLARQRGNKRGVVHSTVQIR
jgi:hypothetical protein